MFYSFGVDFRESLYFSRLGCPKKKEKKNMRAGVYCGVERRGVVGGVRMRMERMDGILLSISLFITKT